MSIKRALQRLCVALFASLGLSSCESWLLGEEESNNQLSYLTTDVEFVATTLTARHLTGSVFNGVAKENFFLEFVGDEREGVKDVLILDLLAPKGTQSVAGEYAVGYEGDYIALSRYDLVDQKTGNIYTGGSFYAEAKGNYLTEYFGYLTGGKVTISQLEEGIYQVVVDALSVERTVKMTYTGKIEFVTPKE